MSFFPFEVAALEWDEMAPNSTLGCYQGRRRAGGVPSCPHVQLAGTTCSTLARPHLPSAPTQLFPPSCAHLAAPNHLQQVICANLIAHTCMRPVGQCELFSTDPAAPIHLLPPGHIHPATPTGLSPFGHTKSSVQTQCGPCPLPPSMPTIHIELTTVSHPILL